MVGEVVYVKDKNGIDLVLNADGSISASISGGTVRILSGDTVQTVIRNVGGTPANVAVMSVDGGAAAQSTAVGLAPNGLVTISALYAAHPTNLTFVRVAATSPISGAGYRVMASISGDAVSIIGTPTVIAQTSGQTVKIDTNTTAKTNALVSCTNASGGTTLPNISCVKFMIRSTSGNNVMYLGGTGAQSPFSGTGIELYGGEATPWIELNNTNTMSVFAATSGQTVSIFAVA